MWSVHVTKYSQLQLNRRTQYSGYIIYVIKLYKTKHNKHISNIRNLYANQPDERNSSEMKISTHFVLTTLYTSYGKHKSDNNIGNLRVTEHYLFV